MRILLAEDDRQLNRAIAYQLRNLNIETDCCFDGEDALFYGEQNIYDVILLDRMLPHMEGTEVLTALRAKKINTPVIMITALGTLSDKVKGLDLGADDYLVKPFAFEELMARIRSVTRRSPVLTAADSTEFCLEDLTLKFDEHLLLGPAGQCTLSRREASLLEAFLRAGLNNALNRTTLLLKVWGPDNDVENGNLDNYIHFLRRRLVQLQSCLQIKTIRGTGYCLSKTTERN